MFQDVIAAGCRENCIHVSVKAFYLDFSGFFSMPPIIPSFVQELKMFEATLLTAKDVAQILRISKALAYRLVTDGQLPAVKFGRTVRVRQEDLQAFVTRNLICKDESSNRVI